MFKETLEKGSAGLGISLPDWALEKMSGAALAAGRYKKFRAMGLNGVRKERT